MHFVTAKSLEDQPIWYCGHWPRPRLQQATWSTVTSCQKREKAVLRLLINSQFIHLIG